MNISSEWKIDEKNRKLNYSVIFIQFYLKSFKIEKQISILIVPVAQYMFL